MKKKKTSYFDRFMSMSDEQRKQEVAKFDKEDLRPGIPLTATKQTRKRVVELIEAEKAETISDEERSELNHYMAFEHLMRLAKVRARQRGGK